MQKNPLHLVIFMINSGLSQNPLRKSGVRSLNQLPSAFWVGFLYRQGFSQQLPYVEGFGSGMVGFFKYSLMA